jgi:hypothetical protein
MDTRGKENRAMTRWLLAALLAFAGLDAAACPLCVGYRPTAAQQLVDLGQAVLAVPTADGGYRVIDVIKGERPGARLEGSAVQFDARSATRGKPLLLARDAAWPAWASFGSIGAEHAGWLRELAANKPPSATSADEWRVRAARTLPLLENAEPLVAEIAYGELASAPYAALLALRARLDAPTIRRWLADPKLAAREPLYLLLLGIAGDARDADALEKRLDAALESGNATNLGSLIAADLQLRGPARMAWVDAQMLRDRSRPVPQVEAALLALGVHGHANAVIPRARVIESYRLFMLERKEIAGYVARDLAAWQYWDAVPEYMALMQSDLRQQYASRIAIVAYLKQSPGGAAGVDLK